MKTQNKLENAQAVAIPGGAGTLGKKKKRGVSIDDWELVFLALPATVMIFLFSYLPIFGIIVAFKNFQVAGGNFFVSLFQSPWCGFDNFKYLFATSDAFIIIRNTVGYNIVFIILGTALQVTLAIMLSELVNQFLAKTYQTIMMLPFFLSWVVIGTFVYAFLASGKGLLTTAHISTIQWYSNPKPWPFLITILNLWKGFGYGTVVYLATIVGIDKELYEAAVIDGASKVQQVRYITLPGIKSVVVILLILAVGGIFGGDFGLFYIIPRQSGPLYNVVEIIDTYVYKAISGTGNMGMSAAAAFFQSVVGCFMLVGTNLLVSKIDPENALF